MITLALSKGRIFEDTLPLLAQANILVDFDEKSRRLILQTSQKDVRILMLRASDVPAYVEHGAADIGVVGYDILLEHPQNTCFRMMNLKIANCRLSVATTHHFDYEHLVKKGARLHVATKYIHQARAHFAQKGVHVDITKLYGSMELAPLSGLADVIVDVVSSGNTLKENHLREVEVIRPISSYLICNKASYKTKFASLSPLFQTFSQVML